MALITAIHQWEQLKCRDRCRRRRSQSQIRVRSRIRIRDQRRYRCSNVRLKLKVNCPIVCPCESCMNESRKKETAELACIGTGIGGRRKREERSENRPGGARGKRGSCGRLSSLWCVRRFPLLPRDLGLIHLRCFVDVDSERFGGEDRLDPHIAKSVSTILELQRRDVDVAGTIGCG